MDCSCCFFFSATWSLNTPKEGSLNTPKGGVAEHAEDAEGVAEHAEGGFKVLNDHVVEKSRGTDGGGKPIHDQALLAGQHLLSGAMLPG